MMLVEKKNNLNWESQVLILFLSNDSFAIILLPDNHTHYWKNLFWLSVLRLNPHDGDNVLFN